jgi:hypothetical protein
MVSLLYLSRAFNESNASVLERWSENVVWQFFSGMEYFSPKLPCDPAQISRFRKILGEAGAEQFQEAAIEEAVAMQAVKKTEFERVIVDTKVEEKAIAHPTGARLLDLARQLLMRQTKRAGQALKPTHGRKCQTLRRRSSAYANAKQFKRLKIVLTRQRTIRGVRIREITRKSAATSLAEEVKIEQITSLQDGIYTRATTAAVDQGYREVDQEVPGIEVIHRGNSKRRTARHRAWLGRRQTIEPVIGDDKVGNWLDRCWLKGAEGDTVHALLCAAGLNIRWLMRPIVNQESETTNAFLSGSRVFLLVNLPQTPLGGRRAAVLMSLAAENRAASVRETFCQPGHGLALL